MDEKQCQQLLILDGAVGSFLENQYSQLIDKQEWMNQIIRQKPEALFDIHYQHCKNGADILTSFTFKTNHSLELVEGAVNQVMKVKDKFPQVMVFGSNGPAEDCYQVERKISQQQLQNLHEQHISRLISFPIDFLIHETMSHLDEIIIVSQISENLKYKYILSFYFDESLHILSGESVDQCLQTILNDRKFLPHCLSFNCIQPNHLFELFSKTQILHNFKNISFGFYVNCGSSNYNETSLDSHLLPSDLVQFYMNLFNTFPGLKERTLFIGSCCLSTPAHTLELSNQFKIKQQIQQEKE